ncbi:PP2C family protein-serine/threonine phosphatase [Tropicimonas sediminicola]|uniref:Serine/threonine protein phosphatase PrpC n=1 Tax=Tropicimonas sediminicola TaxID=1031541 RepID=A0A239JPI9_9RHOB|nr:protein phosphatase 2C domain-containing protein [Tropicimonas sediminicola]SNT07801.1 Serine/threonine protein phosphatase PrpC [Tropicimonas sediminicola]
MTLGRGMLQRSEPTFEAASAVSVGKRAYQEDAVLFDCPVGSETGLVVLSDGMGGHAAGDVASSIVLTEVFSELKLQSARQDDGEAGFRDLLMRAAQGANDCIRAYVDDQPDAIGMGATLVAGVLRGPFLHWISIGDSPLLLFRDGDLIRLNEEHSFGQQMDSMVEAGLMAREVAEHHPDRNCLTSVVGGGRITQIDCPDTPFELFDDDILVFASDGLQFLPDSQIAEVLADWRDTSSTSIAAQLLREIERLDDPDQDNVSIVVIKVTMARAPMARSPEPRPQRAPVTPVRPEPLRANLDVKSADPEGRSVLVLRGAP